VDKFDISKSSGQILTKDPLNHEDGGCYDSTADPTTCTYTVAVEVRDGYNTHKVKVEDETDADDIITVTINVRDRDEPPAVPTVTVTAPSGNETLNLVWDQPENTGPTTITYDVQYRKGSGAFSNDNCGGTGPGNCDGISATTTTIQGLEADTSYSVQVRSRNDEGVSAWSRLDTLKTNKGTNAPPAFSGVSTTFEVAENTPAGELLGDAVSATDGDSDTVTYSLDGVDRASFALNSRNGEIRTRSSLNYEEKTSYSVRVKASDGTDGGSAYHPVTINVTDEFEPPNPPAAPRVTPTKDAGRSLDVTWNEPPRNTGKPAITDYDIRYRKFGETEEAAWQLWPHGADEAADDTGDTDRSATITRVAPADGEAPLEALTQYEVEVRATNTEGTSDWSGIGRARTGAGNRRPVFDSSGPVVTLTVDENTRSGQNVGSAVSATDADGNRLTYSLDGPNKNLFTIVSSSGQIRTRAALDYEERSSYSVTVKVNDGQRQDNSVAAQSVTISVSDLPEPPTVRTAPAVAGISGSTSSVRVTWDEPVNTGPAITDYDIQYGVAGTGGFSPWTHQGADMSAIITGLTAGTRYEVRVRARNDEGVSGYSRSGTGSPNPDVANRNPVFSGGARTLNVAEDTPSGDTIGDPIAATDPDDDPVVYELEGPGAASFDIDRSSGQIRTSAALDHEETSSYSVTVRARDGRGGTSTAGVRINVTDVIEPPFAPLSPTVTAVSSTSVQVSWDAPDNTGPPITDYDYRYQDSTQSWTEVTNTTITATTVTIDALRPSTLYEVEVRATNAEGTSDWSNSSFGSTNAPGANNPPVFDEGSSATRSVSATSPAGTNIGEPVAATDADAGDVLTYSLEGRDAPSFDIDSATGQLRTKSGITLIVGTTYTVTVAADDDNDGIDVARIAVSIEATAAPPNNVPVFSEAPSTTRSVRDDATAGRAVGSPVTATDADSGDTITYSLEGTDAASFTIVATSGQIQTRAALDASTKSTYSVTVVASDGKGRATIAVTITVTAAPLSYGCATNGAVADATNTGLVSDCEALMASRNALEGNARLNWSSARPISQWEGVFLSGTPSRVTMVALRRYGLDGTVPADLGRLDRLVQLNLHSNDLSGSIPPELNNLGRLERLLLHNNQLSGTIPNLSGLRNLEWLWLSGRDMALSGNLPSWLNSMSGLESLSLWGNNLSGSIPRLTGMTSLSLLKLQSNNLSGSVPAWFGDMNGPSILYLHDNELTGSIPANLGRNTGVVRLWLDRNNLSGSIPPALGGMTSLRTLNLRDNQLTGAIPAQLGNLSSLQQLRLHNNQLNGAIPSELGNLSNLLQMWLSGNQLTGRIPAALGLLPRLRDLNLRANNLSGDVPTALDLLSDTLTRLRLGGVQQKDANGVVISETRGNTGLTGCVPRSLEGATDADDLRLAGSAGLSICN
jgi:hypothetical protein